MWTKLQLMLIRRRAMLAVAALMLSVLLRPALAMADTCSGSLSDFFLGCTNSDGSSNPSTLIGLITTIINLILAFIGLQQTNNNG